MVTILDDNDHRTLDLSLLRSAGRPMPGSGISIRDVVSGDALERGMAGEICLRSGSVMKEYWRRPAETEQALADGWLHTGDVGFQDERGYLWVTDRAKDMIISGGENIYTIEVENAISSHPSVLQAAVVGRPHELWGEAVHAFVRLHKGESVTGEELIEHARKRLAGYKVPRSIEIRVAEFPLSPVGKIRKEELRQQISTVPASDRATGQ